MKRIIYIFLVLTCSSLATGRAQVRTNAADSRDDSFRQNAPAYQLQWSPVIQAIGFDERPYSYLTFDGARMNGTTNLPYFQMTKPVSGTITAARVSLENTQVSTLSETEARVLNATALPSEFEVSAAVRSSGGSRYLIVEVLPLRRRGNRIERLEGFDLREELDIKITRDGARESTWKESSVLATGNFYKIATGEDGIYKVTYSFMRECGFDVANLASNLIRLYGTPAGELPIDNDQKRKDDLSEIPIYMADGGDGVFDPGDYFLFYGEDQVTWKWVNNRFSHHVNAYADSAYYFLAVSGAGSPRRIQSTVETTSNPTTVTSYDFYDHHETDLYNLIKSGREWYGEQLGLTPSLDFGFFLPDFVPGEKARMNARFALRSVSIPGSGVSMSLPNQGGITDSTQVGYVSSAYAAQYAKSGTNELEFVPSNSNLLCKMAINYGQNQGALAWIDYIELNGRRALNFLDPFMAFRDTRSVGAGKSAAFTIQSGTYDIRVWDVTDRFNTREMQLSGGKTSGFSFNARTDTLREFVAFHESAYLTPSRQSIVLAQNLHAIRNVQYVVVTHPSFLDYAQQMADLHAERDQFTTAVVTVQEIYNEFSGGAQDITAIKEFMRMLYKRAEGGGVAPEYLLLLGDASYDYKNKTSGNSNMVPSYQTSESLIPTASIVTDDYFGLLDDDEGDSYSDLLDISIGRLPARSKEEAAKMVNKVLYYVQSPNTFGDWRNWVAMVADDPERGTNDFMEQCNELEDSVGVNSPAFNVQKIYLDAYKQVSGSGGERYPDVAAAIDERIRRGALMMFYVGHGGEVGWAHERVLEVAAINKWSNINNMPLFITATCEFTRFDDPRRTSAGEYVMLNPSGGGVALLTTTRAVFSGPNFELTKAFSSHAFDKENGEYLRLGDITRATKIDNASSSGSTGSGANTRCFTLLGDPAMRLAFPQNQVVVTDMPDTIKALDKVIVKGYIANSYGSILTDFNGVVYPTLFDKVSALQSLNNDGEGVYDYTERKNILFRGKASVRNGFFEFEFVVPKDIDRAYGNGKLSFYATNGTIDANGAYFDYIIGGLSDNPIVDETGPEVDLYMNNTKFVFGGLTDQDPNLYAVLSDENGINMVGSGIGHDITAVLDGETSNTLVLNDYYEADIDSYQSGKVVYPFSDLSEGRHTLKMQVWDVNNNPSEAVTEFIVANDEELALEHVLNYPNPFTTNTDFYFEHNKPGMQLDVRIEVFTVSGKLVKTIDGSYGNDGYRIGPINWNGRDEYGDAMGKGVYVYRVAVKTPTGDQDEVYEKLVLLK